MEPTKNARSAYLVPVTAAIALLVFSLMAYAGFLTADWDSLFACLPAIAVTIACVSGMLSGMLLFSSEEGETGEEASHPDGAQLLDRLGARLEVLRHRLAHRFHLRGGH